jgi:hypothetical protein
MTLTKEQMREYQKKRRREAKKNLGVEDKSKIKVETISPVVLKMIDDLRKRVEVLEGRPVEKLVTSVMRKQTSAVSTHRLPDKPDADLFRRVIAEKEARLKG